MTTLTTWHRNDARATSATPTGDHPAQARPARQGRARYGKLAAIAAALAVGLTVAPLQATSALAYDTGSCPSTNLNNSDTIRKDSGGVDFGDDWHLGGAPQGNAIVCWYDNKAKAVLKGKLYNDRFNGNVRAVITTYRGTGSAPILVKKYTTPSVSGNGQGLFSRVVDFDTNNVPTHDLYRLRVSLEIQPNATGAWLVSHVSNVYFGS